MTIAFPWISYGTISDSENNLVPAGVTVTATGDSPVTDDTDSNGKYIINLQNYATDEGTVTLTCSYLGEKISQAFIVHVSSPGHVANLVLKEAIQPKDILLNSYRCYGNEIYIWTHPYGNELSLKTVDY